MIKHSELAGALNKIAPLDLAESWDNSGFQILLESKDIHKILVCLDITNKVIEEAVNLNADLIVSHHPLYFNPLKEISDADLIGRYTIRLLQNGISVYASHTSFDRATKGTNFYLAKLLELEDLHFFDEFKENSIGIFGALAEPLTIKEFTSKTYRALSMKEHTVRVIGDSDKKIQKLGICTGAGMSEFATAKMLGCDAFITGDIKYHEALEAAENAEILIDVGHFDSEKFFVDNMANQLESVFSGKVDIVRTKTMLNPFQVI